MLDPYAVLGVSRTATEKEIKNAYRQIAKKNHPDLNPGNKVREAKFKEAAAAYELIGTPESRAKFDRGEFEEPGAGAGAGARQGGPFYYEQRGPGGGRYSYSAGMGASTKIFSSIFGGGRGGAGPRPDAPGQDQLYQMEVSFADSALGAEREITLPGGKKLRVKIPPGIESGARLRFRGQGGPGRGKGPAGDAYVEVMVAEHPGFRRKGRDIESEVAISFYDALLGAEIEVATVDGKVALKVPPGVSSGSRLRVRGRGVGSAKGERGDQIVALKVVMPKEVPAGLREAAEWKQRFPYEVRQE